MQLHNTPPCIVFVVEGCSSTAAEAKSHGQTSRVVALAHGIRMRRLACSRGGQWAIAAGAAIEAAPQCPCQRICSAAAGAGAAGVAAQHDRRRARCVRVPSGGAAACSTAHEQCQGTGCTGAGRDIVVLIFSSVCGRPVNQQPAAVLVGLHLWCAGLCRQLCSTWQATTSGIPLVPRPPGCSRHTR